MATSAECVIVALDGISRTDALSLAGRLKGNVWGFKVNDLLVEHGLEIIRALKPFGSVFADAKLHDIPNTVANGISRLATAGADLITIHASGGEAMIRSAVNAAGSSKILAVTVLTSIDSETSAEIFKRQPVEAVLDLARVALRGGCFGIVSSPQELEALGSDQSLNGLQRVTPGIRPSWHGKRDDQSRIATPADAVARGANYLVIGRPITDHSDPLEACRLISKELA